MTTKQVFDDCLSVIDLIGNGNSCEVYRADFNGKAVAAKFLIDEDEEDDLMTEFKLQKVAAGISQAVIRPISIGYKKGTPCALYQLAKGVSLYRYIQTQEIKEKAGRALVYGIINELRKLNKAGVFHGDAHLGNIMVSENGTFKIFDFNMGKYNSPVTVEAYNPGGEFYEHGIHHSDYDVNVFLASLYPLAKHAKSKAFRNLVCGPGSPIRQHIQKLRRFMHGISIKDWVYGLPLLHNDEPEKFKERDWMNYIYFIDKKNMDGVEMDKVVVDVNNPHAVYYFSHMTHMPTFEM